MGRSSVRKIYRTGPPLSSVERLLLKHGVQRKALSRRRSPEPFADDHSASGPLLKCGKRSLEELLRSGERGAASASLDSRSRCENEGDESKRPSKHVLFDPLSLPRRKSTDGPRPRPRRQRTRSSSSSSFDATRRDSIYKEAHLQLRSKLSQAAYAKNLQLPALEIDGSREAELSARGVVHRSPRYFRDRLRYWSNILMHDTGQGKLTDFRKFQVHFGRGFANARLGNLEAALEDYGECVRALPHDATACFNRATVLAELGRCEEAIADLTRAIELDPKGQVTYLRNRALLYRQTGKFALSIADYERMRRQESSTERGGLPFHLKRAGALDMHGVDAEGGERSSSRITMQSGSPTSSGGRGRYAREENALASLLERRPPGQRTPVELDELMALLGQLVFLRSVPRGLLRDLCQLARYSRYTKGSCVFKQGDEGNSVFVIVTGKVSVRVSDTDTGDLAHGANLAHARRGGMLLANRDQATHIRREVQDEFHGVEHATVVKLLHAGDSFGELGSNTEVSLDDAGVAADRARAAAAAGGDNDGSDEENSENGDIAAVSTASPDNFFRRTRRRRASIIVEEPTELLSFGYDAVLHQNNSPGDDASESEGAGSLEKSKGMVALSSVLKLRRALSDVERDVADVNRDDNSFSSPDPGRQSSRKSFTEEDVFSIIVRFRRWLVSDRVQILKRCPVFKHWPEDALLSLSRSSMIHMPV